MILFSLITLALVHIEVVFCSGDFRALAAFFTASLLQLMIQLIDALLICIQILLGIGCIDITDLSDLSKFFFFLTFKFVDTGFILLNILIDIFKIFDKLLALVLVAVNSLKHITHQGAD